MPWKGLQNIDPETDPNVTPGSVPSGPTINTNIQDVNRYLLRDRSGGESRVKRFRTSVSVKSTAMLRYSKTHPSRIWKAYKMSSVPMYCLTVSCSCCHQRACLLFFCSSFSYCKLPLWPLSFTTLSSSLLNDLTIIICSAFFLYSIFSLHFFPYLSVYFCLCGWHRLRLLSHFISERGSASLHWLASQCLH